MKKFTIKKTPFERGLFLILIIFDINKDLHLHHQDRNHLDLGLL